ncbi:heme-degrading domain-containing protein [Vogesella oryzae]|uniref:heme-degrading domain-containing protein n=1 Tax=Vogesella oryzae TaxID=1735285 RepID=UPI0015841970|nr:heme-degrading domain-containing protein [Vogesella oryzae]
MPLAPSLPELLQQETELQLPRFNHDDAWQLGSLLRTLAAAQQAPVAIDIHAYGQQLFGCALEGSSQDNLHWIARKRNSVLRFGHSSLYLGEYQRGKGREFEQQVHIDASQYCAHGGSFPLRLKDGGLIGAVTVSGLPQVEDHLLVVSALRQLLASR